MEIGDRIKQKREALDMSQEDLAKKVGYKSRSSINKIESDGRGLPQNKIVLFAKVLNTTPAYLMGWEEVEDIALTDIFNALTSANFEELKRYAEYLLLSQRLCTTENNKSEYTDYIVASYVNELNRYGKKEAKKRVEELTLIPIYSDNSIPIAAHNDDAAEEQQRLMQEDIDEL